MRNKVRSLLGFLSLILLFSSPSMSDSTSTIIQVNHLKFSGIIGPISARFFVEAIDKAERERVSCIVMELDTPGGLDESMREIVKRILSSSVPVVVYVSPPGSRAASAGTFIAMAAHVFAMAPGTNIGAAHPVAFGGSKIDSTMSEKVVNDAAAYLHTLAEKRGRNEEWAELAVRKSISATEKEALDEKVVDFIAENLTALLDSIEGRKVKLEMREYTISTKNARINEIQMGLRYRILMAISNPNIAYFLLMIGMLGLYFEFSNPGAILPGVVGAISLILFLFSLQTLSLNVAGLLLIILATIFFIVDIKAPTHGVLTVGGIVSMILGSVMLFNSEVSFLRVSWSVIIPTVLITALFFVFAIGMGLKAQSRKPTTGVKGLLGEIGEARTKIEKTGTVFIAGEHWKATSKELIEEGEKVKVIGVEKLLLHVEKVKEF